MLLSSNYLVIIMMIVPRLASHREKSEIEKSHRLNMVGKRAVAG